MDVHSWISADLDSVQTKLQDSVLAIVPGDRWIEQADNGGSSIVHLALHLARHHDLAVNTAIRNQTPLFATHRDALGLGDSPPYAGMTEKEDRSITTAVVTSALPDYVDAVFDGTRRWLADVGTMMLDTVPDTGRRLPDKAGLTVEDVGWLHRMWSDKPVWWFLQWPVIGHGHAHVGEATSVRNRMGLSPF